MTILADLDKIFNEVTRRLAAGSPFTIASCAWQNYEQVGELDGWAIGLDYESGYKRLYLKANTKLQATRLHIANRLGKGVYDSALTRPAFNAWIGDFAPALLALATAEQMAAEIEEDQVRPARPAAEQVAEDLVAQHGELGGRVQRALELVQRGQIEFPQYNTRVDLHTSPVGRDCDCPDATHRAIRIAGFGLICKHTLAQYIHDQVTGQQQQAAYRKWTDTIELARARAEAEPDILEMIDYDDRPAPAPRLTRETALPAWAGQRASIQDYLG